MIHPVEDRFTAAFPAVKVPPRDSSGILPFTQRFTTGSSAGRLPHTQVDAVADESDAAVCKQAVNAPGVVAASRDDRHLMLVVRNRSAPAIGPGEIRCLHVVVGTLLKT